MNLNDYIALVGKKEVREVMIDEIDKDGSRGVFVEKEVPALMCLTGFISTSLDRAQAEKFAWSNEQSGHEATLFEIMWRHNQFYFVMDMSAFPDEKEILLFDGS